MRVFRPPSVVAWTVQAGGACLVAKGVPVQMRRATTLPHVFVAAVNLTLLWGEFRVVVVDREDWLPRNSDTNPVIARQAILVRAVDQVRLRAFGIISATRSKCQQGG